MSFEPFEIKLDLAGPADQVSLRGFRCEASSAGARRVLLTGTLHGDEVTAAACLWQVKERLESSPSPVALTILPCVNRLAAQASSRIIPNEQVDLNRCFPGRSGGSLGERLAAALVGLLEHHDALIDVHTAALCVPFVLLDPTADRGLESLVTHWAQSSGLPVIGEMAQDLAALQGLDRSWSAFAMSRGRAALTVELKGFHTLERQSARVGSDAVLRLLHALPTQNPSAGSTPRVPSRLEVFGNSSGLFEAYCDPGQEVQPDERLGVIRSYEGAQLEDIRAPRGGQLLAMQPVSAVTPGSWLATIAVAQ
jgi:predicted deacylase